MQRTNLPSWMAATLRRGAIAGLDSTYAKFRLEVHREHILKVADTQENGREQLRTEALKQLNDPDPLMVERALICLFAVGKNSDETAIRLLKAHEAINVRKAADVCLFELKHHS